MEVKLLVKYHHTKNCNCYGILSDKAAIVIDPGKFTEDVYSFLKDNEDKERIIFITHGHYDHMLGAEELREKTGVPIFCETRNCDKKPGCLVLPPIKFYGDKPFDMAVDKTFDADCDITVGDITVKAIFTPGHSRGGTSFLIGDNLFSGDTVFFETVGVTKYPGGSEEDMKASIKKIKTLDRNIKIFPGHGRPTDLSHELEFNPFFRG